MHLNLDLLLHVGSYTIFHPFVASMIPLCLRAMAAEYDSTSFILTSAYALFLTMCYLLSSLNQRWAYGPPRKVKLLDEVVVVTGGMTGLGRCIAEIYAMKGVGVAVLDVNVKEEGENEGVRWYKCDVGNPSMVQETWSRINDDVGSYMTSCCVSLPLLVPKVSFTYNPRLTQLGTPTILINNAAIVNGKPFLSLSRDEVEQ